MLRAAAKNHERLTVLVDPADYPGVLDGAARGRGIGREPRRRLRRRHSHTRLIDAMGLTPGFECR